MFAVLHSDINSYKSGLLHLTGQPYCKKSRSAKVKDGMEQHTFKNVNSCLNTNTYSYLETSGGQSYNPYLNVVHF